MNNHQKYLVLVDLLGAASHLHAQDKFQELFNSIRCYVGQSDLHLAILSQANPENMEDIVMPMVRSSQNVAGAINIHGTRPKFTANPTIPLNQGIDDIEHFYQDASVCLVSANPEAAISKLGALNKVLLQEDSTEHSLRKRIATFNSSEKHFGSLANTIASCLQKSAMQKLNLGQSPLL